MPLAIAFRDSPHARLTSEIPPRPKARASLAAMSRRVRSSRSGHTLDSFARSPEEVPIPRDDTSSSQQLQPLFIDGH
jgi:hypothetical protein